MDCMGTPTWVRHVQETEWSFQEWHSSCPVRACRPAVHASTLPCAHQRHQSSELARRTWQELARWAMAAHQQQHSASVPASAPAPDCLPRASAKRAHELVHGEQAKRSRPLAELQA